MLEESEIVVERTNFRPGRIENSLSAIHLPPGLARGKSHWPRRESRAGASSRLAQSRRTWPDLLVVDLFGRDYAGLRIGVKLHLLAVLGAFPFPSTVVGF